ncbi:MAG: hypothetical protein AABW79_04145 [Nanoarchaeota archaeon]
MRFKLSYLFLALAILLLVSSYFAFNYAIGYNSCGSACEPKTWTEAIKISIFGNSNLCTAQCVPGDYPTNMYLYFFYFAIVAFIIAIVCFVKERSQ